MTPRMRGLFFARVSRGSLLPVFLGLYKMLGDSQELRKLLEPVVEALGFELVLIEIAGGGSKTLRLFIDAPGGVMLEDCESVSRQVSAELDVEDPISGQYHLEVSSPGLERPLVKTEHFIRFVGERVKIKLTQHHLGRKRVTGVLTDADDTGVVVDVDGEAYELGYAEMDTAKLAPLFNNAEV